MLNWIFLGVLFAALLDVDSVLGQFMTKKQYEETKGGTQKKAVDPLANINEELKIEGYAAYKNPDFANERRQDGLTKLMAAALRPDQGIVKHLIAQGADTEIPNSKGDTPLLLAVSKGHFHPAAELLKGHANIHHRNKKGMNALHAAIAGGQLVMLEALLSVDEQRRYSVDFRDEYIKKPFILDEPLPNGITPLMMACQQGETKMVEKLIAYGAHVNLKKDTGETALMYASIIGHDTLVNLLLKHGADARAQNSMGFTSLMFSAHRGHTEVLSTFIRLINSDLYRYLSFLDARDSMEYSALDHAVEQREKGAINDLMATGATVGKIHPHVSADVVSRRKVALEKVRAVQALKPLEQEEAGEQEQVEMEARSSGEELEYDEGYYYDYDEEEEGKDKEE